MASFNRVILIGNLTRDPELRYTPNSLAVSDIAIAVNDRRKGANGEWIDETTYVDITLWGRTAEVVSEYCAKGSPLMIEGRLKLDTWESEGQKKSKMKVIGEKIQLLGSPKGGGGGAESRSYGGGATQQRSATPQATSQQQPQQQKSYDSAPDQDYGQPMDDVPF